jgi:hypothetical protein
MFIPQKTQTPLGQICVLTDLFNRSWITQEVVQSLLDMKHVY